MSVATISFIMKITALGLAAILLLGGCAAIPGLHHAAAIKTAKPVGFSFTGTMAAPVDATYFPPGKKSHTEGDQCITSSGYDDIATGAQAIVTNAAGVTVGVGTLQPGVLTPGENASSMFGATCVFTFVVAVKKSSDFYGVHIGNQARGVIQYSRADLEAGPHLVLGSK